MILKIDDLETFYPWYNIYKNGKINIHFYHYIFFQIYSNLANDLIPAKAVSTY